MRTSRRVLHRCLVDEVTELLVYARLPSSLDTRQPTVRLRRASRCSTWWPTTAREPRGLRLSHEVEDLFRHGLGQPLKA